MVGEMAVNLRTGSFHVNLNQLTLGLTHSGWIVDRSANEFIRVPDVTVVLGTVLAPLPSPVLSGILI